MTLIEAIRIARNEWEWLSIDANSEIFTYKNKPVISTFGEWWIDHLDSLNYIGEYTGTPIKWEKSLIKLNNLTL